MQSKVAFGVMIAFLFVSLIAIFCVKLIRLYINRVKSYTKLIYEKDLAHQRTLTLSVIETQEQVLDNISRDLHDDAGQQLTYINFQVENLKLDSVQMQEALQPVSESLRNLSESIRSISHSLNNQLLTQKDLIKSIKAEIGRLAKNSPFRIISNISCEPEKTFSQNEKIVIYRIFQENLSNIIRHSQARNVWLTITDSPFTMAISDDGRGFDQTQASKDSLGLSNMRQRAAIIGYDISIRSSPGNGTTVTLSSN